MFPSSKLILRAKFMLLAIVTAAFFATPSLAQMTAGVAKANIDPPPSVLPVHNNPGDPVLSEIHDSLFARALVIADGKAKVILVVADMIVLPDETYERIVAKLAAQYRVPRDHIWLTATHCHTVPWTLDHGYEDVVTTGILAAVANADAHREPVTVGTGNGRAYININRDEKTAKGFILGQNPQGPSNKTVRVVGFFRKDGTPLAILANYAVHAVTLHSSFTAGDHGVISADIPGATDAFLDAHYPGSQALWTSGAAGDQNPILMSWYDEPLADGSHAGTDLKEAGLAIPQRLGQNLALEIIRVTDAIKPRPVHGLRAAQSVLTCPAKADPKTTQPLRISYLGIGPIDLIAISGEADTRIDQHLRRANPRRQPIMLTLTNGYNGYLPDDMSYRSGDTFDVQKTHFAPGCLETGIVKTATKLMKSRR